MQDLTPQQKKLLRLAKLADKGEIAIIEELDILDEKVLSIEEKANEALKVAEETQKMEGHVGERGERGEKGDRGESIKGEKGEKGDTTIVEKVIEKIEVIKEIPIVTKEIREVAIDEKPEALRDKLELLKEDERLDVKAIKGIDNVKLSNEIIDRAIGIVDQRTSFLINKVSNLSDKVDNKTYNITQVLTTGGTFESYSKNLLSYPYEITEVSSTVTTIDYNTGAGHIIKTITEVSPTVTTIAFSGTPVGIPTTKTITEGATVLIAYA